VTDRFPVTGVAGKRVLVTGVLTRRSIAFSVARRAQEEGAEVVLTSFGRARRITERAARHLPSTPEILELDVGSAEDLEALPGEIERSLGGIDAALHAIAHAPADAINGGFLTTSEQSARDAFSVSAYSLKALATALLPAFRSAGGGSLVALHLDTARSWPFYDWMGVSKAALQAVGLYLARYLGPDQVRVNLVSAGLLATPASGAFDSFDAYARDWAGRAPLGWDPDDATAVADVVLFLFSDAARAVTGEVIHADGGAHAVEV
jgi:enoyl ACP reductase